MHLARIPHTENGKGKWPKVSTVGAIRREFEKGGMKSDERHYYVSSAALSPEALLKHARLEWGVESMHWLLGFFRSTPKLD